MKTPSRHTLYVDELDERGAAERDVRLRTGAAGFVYLAGDGSIRNDLRVRLSANSTEALIGHGVVDRLNALALQGRVGTGVEALIPPRELEAARELFYRADTKTYGRKYEFVLDTAGRDEYRIRIDNREYQNTLSALQYLLRSASHEGMAVWLMI